VKGASSLLLRRGHLVAVISVRSDWFGVRVVVEIQVADEPPGTRKYEDRVIVVRASSEARRKAERVTRRDGESYRNVKGERVVRRFKECDCPPRDLGKIPVAQLKRYPTTLERIFGRAG